MEDSPNNDDNNLDTTMADRSIFLMKCPPLVSRSFQSSSSSSSSSINNNENNSATVAKVVVSIDPLRFDDDDSTKFTMELTGSDLGNAPKLFSMDMSKDFPPMSVFSESPGKISVEGKIKEKFDMKPHHDASDSYSKLCRERTTKYMTKSRQIQVIDNEKPIIPMPGILHGAENKKLAKGSETKRMTDRGQMEEIMFKLFEQHPNWTLKELINRTDQPEKFIKDIVKDLCVYNNKGANQGSYELKAEYKKWNEDLKP